MMPSHSHRLERDADDAADEREVAAAFASGDSLRPAPQEAKDGAQASRTRFGLKTLELEISRCTSRAFRWRAESRYCS
jgi:hypothetical protein